MAMLRLLDNTRRPDVDNGGEYAGIMRSTSERLIPTETLLARCRQALSSSSEDAPRSEPQMVVEQISNMTDFMGSG